MKKRTMIGVALLLAYLLGVGLLTGPSLYQLFAGRLPAPKLELIPFIDIAKVLRDPGSPGLGVAANLLGNVLLLAPLGFLLPLFWAYFRRGGRTVLCGLLLSVSIEGIQLISGGVTSVDDVLLNTLGVWLGWLCAGAALRLWPRLAPKTGENAAWRYPLGCWLLVIACYTASDLLFLG